ncbi:MAG TPA: hypothetical protein VFG59_19195 [Anaeromyxobacter sp.]|nr:hypothetical protein [Anaeromyxobacter sp.]
MRTRLALLAALAVLGPLELGGCSRGDTAAKHRLFGREEDRGAVPSLDPAHPEAALSLDADEVARRLGSFDFTGAVDWSVSRNSGAPLHVTEEHRIRQSSTGEFEVQARVDPGLGPSAVEGKQIIFVDGLTYARSLPSPFRERPTDRGRDARRFREDSFGLIRDVAALVGPGLRLEKSGEETVLGRSALRYRFTFRREPGPASPAPAGFQAADPDTARRQGFLRGGVASDAQGELWLDARTGVPLRARLSASFTAPPADQAPGPQVVVAVSAQMKALGGEVTAVSAPAGALPDERKPSGPSSALEAAGLKKRGGEEAQPEPTDEGE